MIQVTLDTIAESQVWLTAQQLRIVRGALVTGLDLDAVGDPSNALPACLTAPGMPQLYDAHPARPAAIVTDYIIRGVSQDAAEVDVIYIEQVLPVGQFRFRVGTSLTQETTQVDKDGNPILVGYSPANSSIMVPPVSKLATLQRLEPLSSLTAVGNLNYSPGDLSKQFTGTVNLNPWQGGDARTWLCTGIEGEQDQNGSLFRTTFTFLYRVRTWDGFAVYVDSNGQIPPDIQPAQLANSDRANGLCRAHLYNEMDFSLLPF